MKVKKIEEMDYYELLNIATTATQQEIERAYLLGKSTYRRDSLAYYSLIPEEERQFILGRIEEAFQTLGNPDKRKAYDSNELQGKSVIEPQVSFRKSTEKLVIEDAPESKNIWKKIIGLFKSKKI